MDRERLNRIRKAASREHNGDVLEKETDVEFAFRTIMKIEKERAMRDEFLNDKQKLGVQRLMKHHGIESFGAWVRFWGEGATIQVDGDVGIKDLECLTDIAIYLNFPPHDGCTDTIKEVANDSPRPLMHQEHAVIEEEE